MTAAGSDTQTGTPVLKSQQAKHPSLDRPLRLLAVVDGSERTNRVVDVIAAIAGGRHNAEAVVLNVQEKRDDARLRGYQTFKAGEIDDRLIKDVAVPIVGSASLRLEKLGIRSTTRAVVGDPLWTIMRCAEIEACDVIVVAASPPSDIQRRLVRATGYALSASVAAQLVLAAPIPVLVVK